MSDKFSKTHPWRVKLLRDVVSIVRFADGTETRLPLPAGERMCRRKSEADSFRDAMVTEHGADSVSAVYKA